MTRLAQRKRPAYRHTNRFVHELTGRRLLSVATDRLAPTAMRCAELLDASARDSEAVDRSGAGRIAEVHLAVALKQWGLSVTGYKTNEAQQRRLVIDVITNAAPWLSLDDAHARLLEQSNESGHALRRPSVCTLSTHSGSSSVSLSGQLIQSAASSNRSGVSVAKSTARSPRRVLIRSGNLESNDVTSDSRMRQRNTRQSLR